MILTPPKSMYLRYPKRYRTPTYLNYINPYIALNARGHTFWKFSLLKNNSKFFTAEFIEQNFENFLQSILLEKNSTFFWKIGKNKFLPQKKKGSQGGTPTIFSGKSDMMGFDIFFSTILGTSPVWEKQ